MTPSITDTHLTQFAQDGYCVLTDVLPPATLELLDQECEAAVHDVDVEMDRLGVDVLGGSRRGRQYSPSSRHEHRSRLLDFLTGDVMGQIRERLLGPGSSLLWEQFSIKFGSAEGRPGAVDYRIGDGNPQSLGVFSWHQDSGYIPNDHPPYLTCWIALDDTTEQNGALHVLPYTELGIRTRVTHVPDPANGDLVGYFGSNPGKLIPVARGTVICFSSTVFHRSGRNETASPRRAFLAQYAPAATEGTPR